MRIARRKLINWTPSEIKELEELLRCCSTQSEGKRPGDTSLSYLLRGIRMSLLEAETQWSAFASQFSEKRHERH